MTLALPAAARQGYDQREIRSRAIHHWRSNEGRIEAMTLPRSETADVPVFTRAATATGTDVNGDTMTFPFNHPAWTWRNSAPHLWLGDTSTPNVCYQPWQRRFGEMSGLIAFNQSGAMAAAGNGWWYIGPPLESDGPRLWIESNGSNYGIFLHNGTSEVSSVLSAAPTDTDTVVFRWELENTTGTTYRVRAHQAVNGGAESSASYSATLSVTDAWPASTRIYYGSLGGQNAAAVELTEDRIGAGVLTLATLEILF